MAIFAENTDYVQSAYNLWATRTKNAQSFKCTKSGTLDSIKWDLIKSGSPGAQTLAVKIYAYNSSPEAGTLLDTSDPINAADIPTSHGLVEFSGFSGAELVANTTYWIVLSISATDGTNWFISNGVNLTGAYADGEGRDYTSGAWNATEGQDFVFEVDGTEIVSDIKSVSGVVFASNKKISGVAIASVKKISGVA